MGRFNVALGGKVEGIGGKVWDSRIAEGLHQAENRLAQMTARFDRFLQAEACELGCALDC